MGETLVKQAIDFREKARPGWETLQRGRAVLSHSPFLKRTQLVQEPTLEKCKFLSPLLLAIRGHYKATTTGLCYFAHLEPFP